MKLRNFLAFALLIGALTACKAPYKATDTGTSKSGTTVVVPAGTQTAFTTQYPGAINVVWSKYDAQVAVPIDWELAGWTAIDADDFLVRFDHENENYHAWYDSDGNWIGSAVVVKDYTQLPAPVNTTVTSKYPGYSITSVNKEIQKDRVAYEIELNKDNTKAKLLVDANGNIIKEKTKPMQ